MWWAASTTAPICAPTTPPTVRTTVFMPVATPVSVRSTASTISLGMAANAKAMPQAGTMKASDTCQGSSCHIASAAQPSATMSIPATSGRRDPKRRPISPAAGPAISIESEAGRIHSPATVTVVPKP